VHPSNYRIVGFTVETPLPDLARLARRRRLPLLMDQGSGNLLDLTPYGVRREPTVQEALRAGVDLVCCSGDKLLGGPQAGLLIGRKAILARLKENPLARALRVDKMIYAALESVLTAHLQGAAPASVPVLSMIALSCAAIEARARSLIERVAGRAGSDAPLSIVPGTSVVGGGSAPDEGLATALVAVRAPGLSARALEARLRGRPLPIVSRIERGLVVLDLRTVLESQEPAIETALVEILRR
jgi:L-seryl-tRNA(Ser) seleniumtransferase